MNTQATVNKLHPVLWVATIAVILLSAAGRTAATVLGTVGGAVAGHQVEKHVRKTVKHEVVVRFEDGSTRAFMFDAETAWRPGDKVKVENNVIMAC